MTPRPKPKDVVIEAPSEFEAMEAAANLLVDAMPTQGPRDVLRETARSQHIPLWMLVCGLLQRTYDSGEYSAPVLDPIWLHANPVKMGGYAEATCKSCAETFRPRWPGQEYCCDLCGASGYRDRVAVDRAANVVELHNYPVGEEPLDRARSTIRIYEADGRGIEAAPATDEVGKLGEFTHREIDPIADIEQDAQATLTR